MRYIVTAATITNDILYADGSRSNGHLGGVVYVAAGIKPFCDDVLPVTTAGPDFESIYGEFYRRNGYALSGVEYTLPKTRYNYLEYAPEGTWKEYSIYGPEFDSGWEESWSILPEYVVKHMGPETKGVYIESGFSEPIWRRISMLREKNPKVKIMWELYTEDTANEAIRKELLETIKRDCDIFSLNLPESKDLFGTKSEEESVRKLIEFGVPCFFRVGKKGAYMIQDGKAWFGASIGAEESVDSTGCGNCSTGAAMFGFCEGFHPLKTVAYANVAAGVNAAQVGPCPEYTKEMQAEMTARAEAYFNELMKGL